MEQVYFVNVFKSGKYGGVGNGACVIFSNEHLSDTTRKQLNTKNCPVVCLVNIQTNQIRYFSDANEIEFCIHGTLASAMCYMKLQHVDYCTFYTTKSLEVNCFEKNNMYTVMLQGLEYYQSNFLDAIPKMIPDCLFEQVDLLSIGSKKLFIKVNSFEALNKVSPDFSFLKDWSKANKINGIYLYTDKSYYKDLDFQARAFNPLSGIQEDLATGIAAGGLCWVKALNAENIKVDHPHYIIGQGPDNRLNEIHVELNLKEKITFITSTVQWL